MANRGHAIHRSQADKAMPKWSDYGQLSPAPPETVAVFAEIDQKPEGRKWTQEELEAIAREGIFGH